MVGLLADEELVVVAKGEVWYGVAGAGRPESCGVGVAEAMVPVFSDFLFFSFVCVGLGGVVSLCCWEERWMVQVWKAQVE